MNVNAAFSLSSCLVKIWVWCRKLKAAKFNSFKGCNYWSWRRMNACCLKKTELRYQFSFPLRVEKKGWIAGSRIKNKLINSMAASSFKKCKLAETIPSFSSRHKSFFFLLHSIISITPFHSTLSIISFI